MQRAEKNIERDSNPTMRQYHRQRQALIDEGSFPDYVAEFEALTVTAPNLKAITVC